jgi:hypothetical protein
MSDNSRPHDQQASADSIPASAAADPPRGIVPPVPAAADSTLDDLLVAIVRRYDWPSFAKQPRRLAEAGWRGSPEGDATLELPGNIVLWSGFSVELVAAIRRLLSARRLFLHPANLFIYMADGAALDLPIAKRAGSYKKPHWLPACLRLAPIPEPKKRKGRRR